VYLFLNTEKSWLQSQIEQQIDNRFQVKREKMLRASSAVLTKSNIRTNRPRNTHSACGVPNRTKTEILPWFPLHTMKVSVAKLTSLFGPSLDGQKCTDALSETGLGKGQEKRLRELKQLFDSSITMFQTDPEDITNNNDSVRVNSDPSKPWSLSCFCYECGRSVGVHLVPCPGCQYVHYCSHSCRMEGFKRGHHEECTGGFDRPASSAKIHNT